MTKNRSLGYAWFHPEVADPDRLPLPQCDWAPFSLATTCEYPIILSRDYDIDRILLPNKGVGKLVDDPDVKAQYANVAANDGNFFRLLEERHRFQRYRYQLPLEARDPDVVCYRRHLQATFPPSSCEYEDGDPSFRLRIFLKENESPEDVIHPETLDRITIIALDEDERVRAAFRNVPCYLGSSGAALRGHLGITDAQKRGEKERLVRSPLKALFDGGIQHAKIDIFSHGNDSENDIQNPMVSFERDCSRHVLRLFSEHVNPKDVALTLLDILGSSSGGAANVWSQEACTSLSKSLPVTVLDEYAEGRAHRVNQHFDPDGSYTRVRLRVQPLTEDAEHPLVRCEIETPPAGSSCAHGSCEVTNTTTPMEEVLYCMLVLCRIRFFAKNALDASGNSETCNSDVLLLLQELEEERETEDVDEPRQQKDEEKNDSNIKFADAYEEAYRQFMPDDPHTRAYAEQDFATDDGVRKRVNRMYPTYAEAVRSLDRIPGERALPALARAVRAPPALIEALASMVTSRARLLWTAYVHRNGNDRRFAPTQRGCIVSLAFDRRVVS